MKKIINKETRGINHLWGRLVVEELVRLGVTTFCVAPGARSAPLMAALGEREDVSPVVHQDERGLAFFALGCAKASNTPSVIITTSGTAVANLVPAAVEAFQTGTPLIIISADRPAEVIDTGANQTIRQSELLATCTVWHITVPAPSSDIDPVSVLSTIDLAYQKACLGEKQGPVHVNMQFREPLLTASEAPSALSAKLKEWEQQTSPLTRFIQSEKPSCLNNLAEIKALIDNSQRGALVCGPLDKREEKDAIISLAAKLQWPVLADITSGLRFTSHSNAKKVVIAHSDLFLRGDVNTQKFSPDVILHFGKLPISRTLLSYLNKAQKACIQVNNQTERNDPFGCITHKIQSTALELTTILKQKPSSLLTLFKEADDITQTILAKEMKEGKLEEWTSVATLFSELHTKDIMYLGNSLPIRHADTFVSNISTDIEVYYQRGASGIDGTIACAAGVAHQKNNPLFLIVGDLTFLHDVTSLQLFSQIKRNVTVVVLNNSGGSIFSYLPHIPELPKFTELFTAPHDVSIASLAEAYGLNYLNPQTLVDLSEALTTSRQNTEVATVIEIKTTDTKAVEQLKLVQDKVLKLL